MFRFYVFMEEEGWVWRLNAHPFMRADAEKLMADTYGKQSVKSEFVEVTHEDD